MHHRMTWQPVLQCLPIFPLRSFLSPVWRCIFMRGIGHTRRQSLVGVGKISVMQRIACSGRFRRNCSTWYVSSLLFRWWSTFYVWLYFHGLALPDWLCRFIRALQQDILSFFCYIQKLFFCTILMIWQEQCFLRWSFVLWSLREAFCRVIYQQFGTDWALCLEASPDLP